MRRDDDAVVLNWNLLDPTSAATLVPMLVEHAARSAVIILAAVAAAALLRNRAASVRHAIWVSVFAAVVLLPAGTWLLPHWEVLPIQVPASVDAARAAIGVEMSFESLPLESDPSTSHVTDPGEEATNITSSRSSSEPSGNAESTRSRIERLAVSTVRDLLPRPGPLSPAQLLVLLWLLGLVWNVTRQAGASMQIRRTARAGKLPPEPMRKIVDRAASRLGLRRAVDVRLSARVAMPATWGGRHPVVLLPAKARGWDDALLWHVLLHEFAHVARRDQSVQTAARAICTVFWFNPLLWLALRALRSESECACDDLVLLSGSTPSRYAAHLVDVARSVRNSSARLPSAALAMAHPSRLEDRIRSILDPRTSRRPMKAYQVMLSLTTVLVLALPVATAAPQVAPPPPPPSEPVAVPAPAPAPVVDVPPVRPAPAPVVESTPEPPAPPAMKTDVQPARPAVDVAPSAVAEPLAPVMPDTLKNRARIIAAFIKALQDPDPDLRRQAAFALAEMEASEAVEPLARLLAEDEEPEVRKAAMYALGDLDTGAVLPYVVDRFPMETDPEMRRQMLWVLAESEDPSIVPAIMSALDDDDPEVRQAAVGVLGDIESDDVIPALMKAASDPEPEVRRHALWALAESDSPDAIPVLVRAAQDSDPEIRRAAVMALSDLDTPNAMDALSVALSDEDPEVRRMAIWGLAESDSGDALLADRLVTVLRNDSDPEVRRAAVLALGDAGGDAAVDALTTALDDSDPEVRKAAIAALANLVSDGR